MADLVKGDSIRTKQFKKAVVEEKLGEGGQGAVYQVDYDGKPKALKWYSGKKLKNPEKFYENLENNIKKGRPTRAFLWPEDITEHDGKAFGYIMDLRPPEFKEFSQFLIAKEIFASVTAMVNAALHITAGFRALHNNGYSYQDLNDGNFFINPKNGDVLICDNDNVSEYGRNSGIAGKARYMAPEIVAKKAKPDIMTDRFSLSVALFLLWTNNHPLEGKSGCPVCMDAAHEKKIYGTNPVFIYDPADNSNRPVQGIHKGAITRWPFLPEYLRQEFIKAFSKELMSDPSKRIIEQEWLRLFIRMRGEIYKCSCGEVYFADPENPNPCPNCKKAATFPFYIKTSRYNLPVHQRTKLYACHTEKDSDDFETLTGEAAAEKNGGFGLKNVSKKKWAITEGESTGPLVPGASFMLKKNMSINFGADTAEIK
ncbi:MAG: serine/threonine-protein kinase [Treponema sp.]|jgi:serine/threonine protein kinase|nr:serine/threonine-protein kinase [Treponema sp.]